jgi:hypothetical protein
MRRGIALVVVLSVVTLLGVLTVATMMAVRGRMAGARRLRAVHGAALATRRTLDSALAAWPRDDRAGMPVGASLSLASADPMRVTRLGRRLYRLDAATARGDALAPARHAASLLVWIDRPTVDVRAPLVAGDAVVVGGEFALGGSPPISGCELVAPRVADVVAADTTRVRWDGSAGAMRQDASLAASGAFERLGTLSLDSLEARADLVLPDGAHWSPSDSARLVVARGDLTLGAGKGRGLLVVRGRLVVEGPLSFAGLVLVLGGVTFAGDDVALSGMLRVRGPATLDRRGTLRADPCALDDALALVGRAVPVGWWAYGPLR